MSTEVCLQTVVIDSQTVSVVLTEQLTIYKLYLLYKCFFIFRHHCVFLSILGLLCNKNMMLLDNKPRYCNLTGTTRSISVCICMQVSGVHQSQDEVRGEEDSVPQWTW